MASADRFGDVGAEPGSRPAAVEVIALDGARATLSIEAAALPAGSTAEDAPAAERTEIQVKLPARGMHYALDAAGAAAAARSVLGDRFRPALVSQALDSLETVYGRGELLEVDGEQIERGMQGMDALLLGRRTYDIFASYWPNQEDDGRVSSIANLFNRIPKYVASRGSQELRWANSTQLGADLPAAVDELRQRHDKIHVIGSLDFVQTLLSEQLFDQLNLWVYPILLGSGKQVFAGGAVPTNLRLVAPAETSPGGSVHLQYERVDGTPATGSMDDLE